MSERDEGTADAVADGREPPTRQGVDDEYIVAPSGENDEPADEGVADEVPVADDAADGAAEDAEDDRPASQRTVKISSRAVDAVTGANVRQFTLSVAAETDRDGPMVPVAQVTCGSANADDSRVAGSLSLSARAPHGSFMFAPVPAHQAVVTVPADRDAPMLARVSAVGYSPVSHAIAPSGPVDLGVVALTPRTVRVSGTLVDAATDRGVPWASVWLHRDDEAADSVQPLELRTSVDGYFKAALTQGDYALKVEGVVETASRGLAIVPAACSLGLGAIPVTVRRVQVVAKVVRRATGKRLSGVQVKARSPHSRGRTLQAESAADGTFQLGDVAATSVLELSCTVCATPHSTTVRLGPHVLAGSDTCELSLSMDCPVCVVSGTVTDPIGLEPTPVVGATVTCEGQHVVTDDAGRYSLTVVAGSPTLVFEASGMCRRAQQLRITPGTITHDMVMVPKLVAPTEFFRLVLRRDVADVYAVGGTSSPEASGEDPSAVPAASAEESDVPPVATTSEQLPPQQQMPQPALTAIYSPTLHTVKDGHPVGALNHVDTRAPNVGAELTMTRPAAARHAPSNAAASIVVTDKTQHLSLWAGPKVHNGSTVPLEDVANVVVDVYTTAGYDRTVRLDEAANLGATEVGAWHVLEVVNGAVCVLNQCAATIPGITRPGGPGAPAALSDVAGSSTRTPPLPASPMGTAPSSPHDK